MTIPQFNPPRDRDAWATIRGYVYQVDLIIDRWLQLNPGEVLELERGEDIDLVYLALNGSQEEQQRILEQVKHRDNNLTLRSSEAINALASYYEQLYNNPNLILTFRYVTNSKIGKERNTPLSLKNISALTAWDQLRKGIIGEDDRPEILGGLKSILEEALRPAEFNKDSWEIWRKFITTATKDDLFDFISRVEWSTFNPSPVNLERQTLQKLIDEGYAASIDVAKLQYHKLFVTVFRLLSNSGLKRLSLDDLKTNLSASIDQIEESILVKLKVFLTKLEDRVINIEQTLGNQQQVVAQLDNKVYQLASQIGMDAAISYSIQTPFIDLPLVPDNLINRQQTVYDIIRCNKTWIGIHGNIASGKTLLAFLISESLGICKAWIRLRGLNSLQTNASIDSALAVLVKSPPFTSYQSWVNYICSNLEPGDILVFDDLPRILDGDPLNEKLAMLAKACSTNKIKILSTSHHPFNVQFKAILGDQLANIDAPGFSDEEISELFKVNNSPPNFLTEARLEFIRLVTRRHPLLLTAVIRYFASTGWVFSETAFRGLIRGEHADELFSQTQAWLMATVYDPDSRDLLYRLNLVGNTFKNSDVSIISNVSPPIQHPYEKISSVVGLWVQQDSPDTYIVSPLLNHIGSGNLTADTQINIHNELGDSIIGKDQLGPLDIMKAVSHFCSAKQFNKAGQILVIAFNSIRNENNKVHDYGLTELWYGIPLPVEMELDTRLFLRATQIAACEKLGKNTETLLNDLDRLMEEATNQETFGVISVALLCGMLRAGIDPNRANGYLLKALKLGAEKIINEELPIPLSSMIWISLIGINTQDHLHNWMSTIEQLTPEQREEAFNSIIADEGCMMVSNTLWLKEVRKPAPEQNWGSIAEVINELSVRAKAIGLELLWACSIRAQIIVYGEYIKDLDRALKLATESLPLASADPKVQFVIKESVGLQLAYANKPEDAIKWLLDALQYDTDSYILERIQVLLYLSKLVGPDDCIQSIVYTELAVELANNEVVPEITFVKVLGEHALSLWLKDGIHKAFQPWAKAAKRLINCKEDSNDWKSLFVVFGHVSGYLTSFACQGRPPQTIGNGEEYAAPQRGIFLNFSAEAANVYNDNRDWMVATHISKYAEAIGEYEQVPRWALRALEMSHGYDSEKTLLISAGLEALPHLIIENRFQEVIDLSLDIGATFQALELETKSGNQPREQLDIDSILGPKPNDNWINAESNALYFSLIPIFLRLATLKALEPERCKNLAKTVIDLLHQVAIKAVNSSFWTEAANCVESVFIYEAGWKEILDKGNKYDSDLELGLKSLCYLGASLLAIPEYAVKLQISVFPLLYDKLSSLKSLYRLIVIPFVSTFWSQKLKATRFRFQAPAMVELGLEQALQLQPHRMAQGIFKTITSGLGVKLSEQERSWINEN